MKFTRVFLLKVLNSRQENIEPGNNPNPWVVFKEIIIAHPNIDLALSLILSIVLLITKYSNDTVYEYEHNLNFYISPMINVNVLILYFVLEHFDKVAFNNKNGFPFLNKYWHIMKAFIHLVKVILCLCSYFLSIVFSFMYSGQKHYYIKEKYFLIHFLILEFFDFYSSFRFCYFLIKVILNIILIPAYLSSVILGFLEDDFNKKLNNLVNTKHYTGRNSIRKSTGRISETEGYCSICLNNFQMDELVSTLPCSRRHTFHTLCLEKWFLSTVTCPLCRSDFQNSIDIVLNNENNNQFELRQMLI